MTVKCPSLFRPLFNEVARKEERRRWRIRGGPVFANTYLYWWPFNRRSFPIEFNLYPSQVGLAINKMVKRRRRGHSKGMCLALFLILVLMGHLMEIAQFYARLLLEVCNCLGMDSFRILSAVSLGVVLINKRVISTHFRLLLCWIINMFSIHLKEPAI